MSIWFITSASRGRGAEVTRAALARGHQVVATARDAAQVQAAFPDAGDALLAVPLDVTDPAQIDAAVHAATDRFCGIDVLINAGCGLPGAVEEATDAEIPAIYDVSVLAMLAVTRAVLPVMRAARNGTIVNLSPIGGPASHAQPRDPVKGAQAIVDAVDDGAVPVRLFPGSDTIARVSQKTAAAGAEPDRRRTTAVSITPAPPPQQTRTPGPDAHPDPQRGSPRDPAGHRSHPVARSARATRHHIDTHAAQHSKG
jgi:NAD(P)-dependent dehydrogenase (short-subunit alcohol dehydrogenase family)